MSARSASLLAAWWSMTGIHGMSRRRLWIFLTVLVALVVLVAGVFVAPRAAVWLWPVDHTVAETVAPDREIPGTVSEVAWKWRPPEDELIDGVLPVPNGAVAVFNSGVVALEGVTGEEMWHYRRSDAAVRSANVTPDGESVVASFSDMDVEEDTRVETVVVLDGRSGEIRDEYELPSPSVEESASRFSHVTDEVFLAPGENAMGVDAFALEGGERVWSYEGGGADERGPCVVAGDAVITTGTVSRDSGSGEETFLLMAGLDATTGEVLWEAEHRYSEFREGSFDLRHEPSWGAVHLRYVEPDEGEVGLLLDPVTGETVARPAAWPFWVLEDGYVTRTEDPENDDLVRYSYTGFDDTTERKFTAGSEPGLHPGLATGEGVLRLHYLEDDGVTRKPIMLEMLPWGGGTHEIDLGFDLRGWQSGEGGGIPADMFVPQMIPVPGAIVVLEEENWGTEMAGLN